MWTDTPIPRSALILGLAGLLPFAWGALMIFVPSLYEVTLSTLGPRFVAPFVLLQYGTIILCFMSGVLWGFATRAEGAVATTGYALSVLPALWAFFMVGGGPVSSAIALATGFIGLLGLDWMFWNQDLAPRWWMKLRLILTGGVVLCLSPVFL